MPWLCLGPERGERPGSRPLVALRAQRIFGLQVQAGQRHVVSRNVMVVRQPFQPAELIGVQPDDAAVGQRSLREVEPTVRPGHGHVGVVVAEARQAVADGLASAARRPAADPAGIAAFGDQELAVVEAEPVDREAQVAEERLAFFDRTDLSDSTNPPDPSSGRGAGKGEARLSDPGGSGRIEGEAGGKVQPVRN
ncbi:MAG TPA: hypothetical protein VKM72_29260 [Thermoanaerobaculia bacterium]|nr:hypothetical protein [Thermoanaerobaculia bacterium]